tara:strand:+ start:2535 stop:2759 length:225 start_codon:yes stop_codon:yes gene_type:complete
MSETVDLSQQALDHFIELLEKKDFKNTLISALNEDIDIPFINEKTEKKAMDALYKLIVKSLKKIDIESLVKKQD